MKKCPMCQSTAIIELNSEDEFSTKYRKVTHVNASYTRTETGAVNLNVHNLACEQCGYIFQMADTASLKRYKSYQPYF